jgi:hypothetical protein
MSFPKIRWIAPLVFALAAAALLAGWAPQASARGNLGAGVMFRNDLDFGVQGRWTGRGGDRLSIVPQFGYFFDDEFFDINLDAHLALGGQEKTSFYALGGVNWLTDFDDSEIGVNLGGGLAHPLSGSITGFLEVKYVISDADGLALQAGIHL